MLGLISDTHGLLRPEALDALRGSDLIIHAGDVGRPEILEELRAVAPVTVVKGNIDQCDWPATARLYAGPASVYVLHNLKEIAIDPAAEGIEMVVSGHSHKPSQTERGGVLYLNPGSAGARRFRLPVTVARLDLEKRPWRAEFIHLSA